VEEVEQEQQKEEVVGFQWKSTLGGAADRRAPSRALSLQKAKLSGRELFKEFKEFMNSPIPSVKKSVKISHFYPG
jgi:hypothetical protein